MSGNGDGVANPGEALNLQVALTNHGTNTITGAEASVSTSEGFVSLLDADASYGTVAPGATVSRTFQVSLDTDAPGGLVLPLRLDATAGAEAWTSLVNLTISGARGSFNRFTFGGPGGTVDPGESGTVGFDLANTGNLATTGVSATLSCNSQWVTVTDASGAWGSIPVNAAVSSSNTFAISVAADCYPGHLASLEVELAFAEGGTQVIDLPGGGGHGRSRRPHRPRRLRLLRLRQRRHGPRGAHLRLVGDRGHRRQHRHHRQQRRRRRDAQLRPAVPVHLLRRDLRPRVHLLQRLAQPSATPTSSSTATGPCRRTVRPGP